MYRVPQVSLRFHIDAGQQRRGSCNLYIMQDGICTAAAPAIRSQRRLRATKPPIFKGLVKVARSLPFSTNSRFRNSAIAIDASRISSEFGIASSNKLLFRAEILMDERPVQYKRPFASLAVIVGGRRWRYRTRLCASLVVLLLTWGSSGANQDVAVVVVSACSMSQGHRVSWARSH